MLMKWLVIFTFVQGTLFNIVLVNIFVLYPLLVSESVLLFHGCETLGIVTDSGIFASGSVWTCVYR